MSPPKSSEAPGCYQGPSQKNQRQGNATPGAEKFKYRPVPPPDLSTCERAVVSCLLSEPDASKSEPLLRLVKNAPESFQDLQLGEIVLACQKLIQTGSPVFPTTVMPGVSCATLVSQLYGESVPIALAEHSSEIVWKSYRVRKLADMVNDFQGRLQTSPDEAIDEAPNIFQYLAEYTQATENATGSKGLPAFEDLGTLVNESVPTPPAIVDGLIRRGEKCVIGGASKSFKSWLVLDLALSVAHGIPWLERQVTPGRVLVVNLELPRWNIRSRLKEIAFARGIKISADRVLVWNLRGKNVPPEILRREIASRKPSDLSLVIIDPAYKLLFDREENNAKDIAGLLNQIEGISEDTGAAVVIPAHFAKGNASGKEAMDRISGSGVFARDPDSIITLTRHEEESAFVVESVLRTFPPCEPFVVVRKHPVFSVEASLDPVRLKKPPGSPGQPAKFDPQEVLSLLDPKGMAKKDWAMAANEVLGVTKSTFYRIAKDLLTSRSITSDRSGFCIPKAKQDARPYAD